MKSNRAENIELHPATSSSRQRLRRWLPRFGLRTLLMAVTAICILVGMGMVWYRSQLAEYRRHEALAEKFSERFGWVRWESHAPPWLHWIGEWKALDRIAGVAFFQAGDPGPLLDDVRAFSTIRGVLIPVNQLSQDVARALEGIEHVKIVTICTERDLGLNYGQPILPLPGAVLNLPSGKNVMWGPGSEIQLEPF